MLSKREIKWVNSLKNKKYRYIEQSYIAEGPRLVDDLLLNGQTAIKIFKTSDCLLKEENRAKDVQIVTGSELKNITALTHSHEVLAVFSMNGQPVPQSHKAGEWGIALDFIQDPGNLGTILRTMDWLAIDHLYCSNGSVDMYNPKVVQAAMGATARVKVTYVDLPEYLNACSVNKYAADMNGMPIGQQKIEPGILVFGNEGNGLSPEVREICDQSISIPRLGGGESLNVAISVSIMAALVRL